MLEQPRFQAQARAALERSTREQPFQIGQVQTVVEIKHAARRLRG